MNHLFVEAFESPVGKIEVTATDSALQSIRFVDEVGSEVRPSSLTSEAMRQMQAFFDGHLKEFSLPLEPTGTPFERQVWDSLLSIDYGTTCSYLDIANRLKNPGAIRAVGRANGANPIAIVIPCHRVIGSDGSLTGYGGGLWRKRWLLDHEARVAGTSLF